METYTIMRQFADSWGLLAMVLFFLAVLLRVLFSPSAKEAAAQAAAIPFDEKPVKEAQNGRT
ncbi:MAG: cbb3-type cytochrome c oxidase subunit 3 [Neomegalonema sp.]|nr:cbb3-type cytochrome c oxidase subunit 3 [Neomegalonema sp.]